MKAAAALVLLAIPSACAFLAPLSQAPRGRSRGVARMAFEGEVGVTGPLGYW